MPGQIPSQAYLFFDQIPDLNNHFDKFRLVELLVFQPHLRFKI